MTLPARSLKIATLATAALLAACGGGGGGGGSGGSGGGPIVDAGTLKVALTDAPACGFDQINITLQKVRVHQSSTAADGDTGWSELILSSPQRIDLLSLTNGNVRELGQVPLLPVGKYRQMSLVLAAANPLDNAVTPSGLSERALAIPASLQGGLKMPVDIDIVKDQTSDYVIDFDACNSVLRLGTSGNYQLSPRYSVVRRASAGQRVTGFVSMARTLDPTRMRVSLQLNGTIVRSTTPDSTTGGFVLYPVPAGTYDLVISVGDLVPAVVTGILVSETASTDINGIGTPIDPPSPVLPQRTVSGTVTTSSTPVDARVVVIKSFAGGNVVVFGAPADATTGVFNYIVSAEAPMRAAFTASTPLAFAPDNAVPPGIYTIAVTAKGTTQSVVVDATPPNPAPVSFNFP